MSTWIDSQHHWPVVKRKTTNQNELSLHISSEQLKQNSTLWRADEGGGAYITHMLPVRAHNGSATLGNFDLKTKQLNMQLPYTPLIVP